MTITTYDAATGITTEEELSEELAAERAAELQAIEDAKAAKIAAIASAQSKLEAIGLTADEIAALRG